MGRRIDELKRALVEVREMCLNRTFCDGCPFKNERINFCPIQNRPDEWDVDNFKEDTHEAD